MCDINEICLKSGVYIIMIAFKKMWNDVSSILLNNDIKDINIINKYKSGFIVDECGDVRFVTKDDFIDFWCRICCVNEISEEQILKDEQSSMKYVYAIIKNLPYISEKAGVLKITE